MRPSRRTTGVSYVLGLLALCLFSLLLVGAARPAAAADPTEVRRIAAGFWVPGSLSRMTADRSQLPAARALRAEIALLLEAGLTPTEVRESIIERYGESLLAAPPHRGLGLAAWIVPGVALAFGALGVIHLLRTWVGSYQRNRAGLRPDSEVQENWS